MEKETTSGHLFLGKRIDFHTHILHNMDDGSSSLEMSRQMIRTSMLQGICCIILTPHFYASQDYPAHFLQKRERLVKELVPQMRYHVPLLIAGAEVQYFEGITIMEDLPAMRISKSPGLLLEMPFCTWSDRMVEDVLEINNRQGYRVVLAHIERYVRYQKEATLKLLVNNGVLLQSNASFFTEKRTSRKAFQMLDKGLIHLLGSDCHNMTSRPPNVGEAYDLISQKRGAEAVESIIECGMNLLLSDAWTGH